MIIRNFLPAVMLSLPFFLSCQEKNAVPDIIPAPVNVEMGRGYFSIPDIVGLACPDSSFFMIADFLGTCLEGGCARLPGTSCRSGKDMDMTVGGKGDIAIVMDGTLDPSGAYRLDVSCNGVRIACSSYTGAVSAAATLGQMVRDGKIPAAHIVDSPRFAWRGFMLDVSRHFFTVDEVKALLSELAMYKFNKFHWHLTDDQGWRVEIKSYPRLAENGGFRDPLAHDHDIVTAERAKKENDPASLLPADRLVDKDGKTMYGGYYTQDEIRDVVAYAASLGMDVIPEIDMPGHSLKIIESYPELSCKGHAVWGKDFSVPLCPGNDATLEFARTVYKEIFDLFPYGYVHIGADEVEKSHWDVCPKCKTRKAENGLADSHDLQDWFVSRLEAFCAENGKTVIGWDEIASKPGFSKNAVVQWWRPWAPASKKNAAENGNAIILSPNEFYYMDISQNRNTLMKVYGYEPLDAILDGYEDQILGLHGNLWTEYVTSFESICDKLFPRMFAVSETAWSEPQRKDAEDFARRVNAHLERLNANGWNYRVPDLDGFCDSNVFDGSVEVNVTVPVEGVTVRYTMDGSVPGPESEVFDSPLTINEDCVLAFRAFTMSGVGGATYTAVYRHAEYIGPAMASDDADGLAPGLLTSLYNGKFQGCSNLPAKADAEYVSGTMALPENPAHDFGLVFRGYVNIPEDGVVSFYTYSDDGTVMIVSGEITVDNDGLHSREERSGQALLKKGWHPIELRYFDHGGGFLEAGFIMSDGTRRPFVPEDFRH